MLNNHFHNVIKDPDNYLRPFVYQASKCVPLIRVKGGRIVIFENADYVTCVCQIKNCKGKYEYNDTRYNIIIASWSKAEYIEYYVFKMFQDYSTHTKMYRDWSKLNGNEKTTKENYLYYACNEERYDIEDLLRCEIQTQLKPYKKLYKNTFVYDGVIQTILQYVGDCISNIIRRTVDYVLLGESSCSIIRTLCKEYKEQHNYV